MAYDGFISYSHAADGGLAPALERGLQRLAKPWNSRRALRIFRDDTGLSTNPHLWSSIEKALDVSEWFVLLASEEAAQSEWVNKEITHWLATKGVERILPVVTDGSWDWDPAKGDFTAASSGVPEALRGALRDEPRHLDLRWARDETDLDLRNSHFRSAVADLAAPMHGVAKDELEGEDIRQHRRARRLARGAMGLVTVLMVIAVVVSIFALAQRNSARTATAAANERLLESESQAQLDSNHQLATLLALEADRRAPSAATRNALVNAVVAEPPLQRVFATAASSLGALVGHRAIEVSTNRGMTPNPDIVQVWDWQTGHRVPWRSTRRSATLIRGRSEWPRPTAAGSSPLPSTTASSSSTQAARSSRKAGRSQAGSASCAHPSPTVALVLSSAPTGNPSPSRAPRRRTERHRRARSACSRSMERVGYPTHDSADMGPRASLSMSVPTAA